MRFWSALPMVVAATMNSAAVSAQHWDDSVLVGLGAVDAQVLVDLGRDLPRYDESTLQSRIQTVFELELRKQGISVTTGASNYLLLYLNVLYNEGLCSYSHTLELWEFGLPSRRIAPLFAADDPWGTWLATRDPWIVSWGRDGIVTVGLNNLQTGLEQTAVEEAQAFAAAYLRVN